MDLRLIVLAFLTLGSVARAQVLSPGKLANAHADLDGDDDCSKCHSSGRKVDEGKCLSCHDDLRARIDRGAGLHGRNYKDKDCESCHVEHLGRKARLIRWPGGAPEKLEHALTGWPLKGEHADETCAKCHDRTNQRGNKTFLGAPTDCASCHKDPHNGRMGKTCNTCHNESDFKKVDLTRFDHQKTRFPLLGKHKQEDCKSCHGEPAKYAPLKFDSCNTCHEDPHKGRFKATCESCHTVDGWEIVENLRKKHPGLSLGGGHAAVKCTQCHDQGNAKPPSKGDDCVDCHKPVHKAPFGRDCEQCHKAVKWVGLPREIGLAAHTKTEFALKGEHVKKDCASCHPKRKFRGLDFDTCDSCHENPHPEPMGDCASCHTEKGFAPTTFGLTQHAKTFALEGKHEATPCGSCHPGTKPRLDFRVANQTCAGCHENPHGNQFAAEMAKDGCASCHSVKGWEKPRIEHAIWPLTGAHADTACARCHGASGAEGTYRGTPRDCDGCHEDQHAGQFRLSEPRRDCAQCHVTNEFALPGFDHAKKTAFTLDGAHAKLDCQKCHPTETLRNGTATVRWRLGYDSCKACHANPHTEAAVGEMGCADCHTTASFALAAGSGGGFDHAKTGFPLTGGHEGATCGDCHGGGRETTRACASCHTPDDAHAGRLGTACAECHTPVAWQATNLLDQHRRTRLPLTGQHALATCNDCHARSTERTWTTPPADCYSCHRDELRGDVHPDHAELPRDCAQCHRPTGWSPAVIVPRTSTTRMAAKVVHETRFPITSGPHRNAACVTCHPVTDAPRVVTCEGCHEHAPTSPKMKAAHVRVGGARGACLTCHPAGVAR